VEQSGVKPPHSKIIRSPSALHRLQRPLTWYPKDEVMRRGRVYYAKLAGGRLMFVAPRLISHFDSIRHKLKGARLIASRFVTVLIFGSGEPSRTRTCDPLVKSAAKRIPSSHGS
jgi:hypothetical protein